MNNSNLFVLNKGTFMLSYHSIPRWICLYDSSNIIFLFVGPGTTTRVPRTNRTNCRRQQICSCFIFHQSIVYTSYSLLVIDTFMVRIRGPAFLIIKWGKHFFIVMNSTREIDFLQDMVIYSIHSGYNHVIFNTEDGLYSWGSNDCGQLGRPSKGLNTIERIPINSKVKDVLMNSPPSWSLALCLWQQHHCSLWESHGLLLPLQQQESSTTLWGSAM